MHREIKELVANIRVVQIVVMIVAGKIRRNNNNNMHPLQVQWQL
jgi:hypothetical protein